MPQIKIRPEGQITIPKEILQAWSLQTNDVLDINLINGVVSLTPVRPITNKKSIRTGDITVAETLVNSLLPMMPGLNPMKAWKFY